MHVRGVDSLRPHVDDVLVGKAAVPVKEETGTNADITPSCNCVLVVVVVIVVVVVVVVAVVVVVVVTGEERGRRRNEGREKRDSKIRDDRGRGGK